MLRTVIEESAAWATRLALAAVFAAAAFGKLTARDSARDAVTAFGVPTRLVPTVAWTLPAVEILIAVGLLTRPAATVAAAAGLGLLVLFTATVAFHLVRGNHPACACFGETSAVPIGNTTLVRNGVLLALGTVTLVSTVRFPGLPAALGAERALVIAAVIALGSVQVWQGSRMRELRRKATTRSPSEELPTELPIGTVAPEFELPGSPGTPTSLGAMLVTGRPQLLVFLHPTCRPCKQTAGELPVWSPRLDGRLDITVVGSGDLEANELWGREYGITRYLVQREREVSLRYAVRGTPVAVLVDPGGRSAAPLALGPAAIRRLISEHQPARPMGSS